MLTLPPPQSTPSGAWIAHVLTRHHRSDRYTDHVGNLAIGQIVDFAQNDRLPKLVGKLRNETADCLCVPLVQHFRFWRELRLLPQRSDSVLVLVRFAVNVLINVV